MKAFLSVLAVPFLLLATASADLIVEMKVESPVMNANTTTKIKGDKMRTDINGGPTGPMSMITDTKTGDTITLVHSQKMAMKISAAQLKQASGLTDGATTPPKATGQMEKVGDYDCEIYTWNDGKTSGRLWVAKNHPQADALKAFSKQMRNKIPGNSMGPDDSTLPGPAIKTELTAQGLTMTSSILSVKDQSVDPKDFDVPADYKSMAMPTFPGGK